MPPAPEAPHVVSPPRRPCAVKARYPLAVHHGTEVPRGGGIAQGGWCQTALKSGRRDTPEHPEAAEPEPGPRAHSSPAGHTSRSLWAGGPGKRDWALDKCPAAVRGQQNLRTPKRQAPALRQVKAGGRAFEDAGYYLGDARAQPPPRGLWAPAEARTRRSRGGAEGGSSEHLSELGANR